MTDRLPPQNIEAEEGILGGILLDPNAIGRVVDILTADAFYVSVHQQIYKAAIELYHQDRPTDLLSITSWLSDHQLLQKVGGRNKLAQLVDRTVSAVNIDRFAELILDKYKRRHLIATATEILDFGYDTSTKLETILEKSEEKIFRITEKKTDRFKAEPIRNCLGSVWNKLQQGQTPALLTGLRDLDTLIGGLVKEDLIVIAARASMGKTWFGCHFANHVAITYKLPVVFFSAEMSKEQLTKRFLAMHSSIDSHRLTHNKVYKKEMDALAKALGMLSNLPIIIDDTPASIQTPTKMRSLLRRIKSEMGDLGLIVMDYIQKLGDRAASNRAQTVGKFSGAFKDIAKEFDSPFVALAQINRGVESQTNKRPTMADIKDSGDIEQDMDLGLLLYRDEYYNPDTVDKSVMEIHIAKNRNGATGVCKVLFDPSTGNICNAC